MRFTRKNKRGGARTIPTPPPLPPTRKSIPLDKLKAHILGVERTIRTKQKFTKTIERLWAKMKQQSDKKSGSLSHKKSGSSHKKSGSSSQIKGGRKLTRTRRHK